MSRPRSQLVNLSRLMSLVLRHDPGSVGLSLDPDGFVAMADLVAAIRAARGFDWVTPEDVLDILALPTKPRFEIAGDRIRARWGHSTPDRIEHRPAEPPGLLYHGTSRKALEAIFREGLKAMSRQYVHLSPDTATALGVGGRHDRSPVILAVRAHDAWKAGVTFYNPDPGIWLAVSVPPEFLQATEK